MANKRQRKKNAKKAAKLTRTLEAIRLMGAAAHIVHTAMEKYGESLRRFSPLLPPLPPSFDYGEIEKRLMAACALAPGELITISESRAKTFLEALPNFSSYQAQSRLHRSNGLNPQVIILDDPINVDEALTKVSMAYWNEELHGPKIIPESHFPKRESHND